MYIGHDPVVIPYGGNALILHRTPVDGDKLTNRVAITDLKPGRLTRILLVLRRLTDGGKLEYPVFPADAGLAIDDNVWPYFSTGADNHTRPDNCIRSNSYIGSKFCTGINNCRRMDQVSISCSVHMISAVATILPSTLDSQANTQIPRLERSSLAWSIS